MSQEAMHRCYHWEIPLPVFPNQPCHSVLAGINKMVKVTAKAQGAGCSKLTTSLVNVSLKFQT